MRLVCVVLLIAACGSPKQAATDANQATDGAVIDGAIDGAIDGPSPDADPCAGGTCECTSDAGCAAHAYCEPAGHTCACVSGYTDGGAGCVWTGVVADPGVVNPAAWTTTKGAVVTPTATGVFNQVDPGSASCTAAQACDLPVVSQVVTMPPSDRAEPLVLEVSHQGYLAVGIGGAWSELYGDIGEYRDDRICLGAAGYGASGVRPGAPITVAFEPVEKPAFNCPSNGDSMDIDHVAIVPANAGECPAIGQMTNGDAEGTGGWTFTTLGDGVAGIVAGVGNNASHGALIRMVTNCNDAVMSNTISVPATGSPAIEMFWRATAATSVPLQLDEAADPSIRHYLTTLAGTGASATTRWCLPDAVRGRVVRLRAQIPSQNGACQVTINHELVLDDIRTVDDPLCANADAGFESGHPPSGAIDTPPRDAIDEVTSATLAHAGNGALRMQTSLTCEYLGFEARPIVPAPNATGGPVLRFFYNVPNHPNTSFTGRDLMTSYPLATTTGWTAGSICLDPDLVGRPSSITFNLQSGGACNTAFPVEADYLDDLSVGNDPACPSN